MGWRRDGRVGEFGRTIMRVGVSGTFWNMEATGSGQYLRHLLTALASSMSPDECTLFFPSYLAQPPTAGVPWPVSLLSSPFDGHHRKLAKVWFEQVAYPRACRRAGVHIAHVPYFAPPLFPTVPTVVTIHDLIPLILPEYRATRYWRGYMRLVSTAARRAALVLTDSKASARDIRRLLGIPSERIRVIYLASHPRYRPLAESERQPVLERLQLPPRYLLYLGGFDRRKNVIALLRAFARARGELGEVSLVIAGRLPREDSAFAPDPRKESARPGLGDAVCYTGWVEEGDKPALYAGALAFVFPSLYEGFGLPVLESISCGTPVIVGQGSSLEEVAGPGGLAVPPGDVGRLADALVRLVSSPQLRERLSLGGLEHASRFSWRETARRTLAAYRWVLRTSR